MATQYTAGITQGQVWTADIANQIGAVWETWTPNFTPGTGAWTNTSLIQARYGRINKLVFGQVKFQILAFGTANGTVNFTLPVNCQATSNGGIGVGREMAVNGNTFHVWSSSATGASIRFYNDGPAANNNFYFGFFFVYEAA